MKRKRKEMESKGLSARRRYNKMINDRKSNKLGYKYINLMGGYVFTCGTTILFDIELARYFHLNSNCYRELTKGFSFLEHNGISYYDNMEQIELLLVTIKMIGGKA